MQVLEGGRDMPRVFEGRAAMERDLLTGRRKAIWRPFMRAVREYGLIRPGDRVAVCVSGGKDSMLLAVLMDLLARRGDIPFEAVNLVMDPGYSPENRRRIEENLARLELGYTLFESDVFDVAYAQDRHPCFLCARMRRGCLYDRAAALGCNRIALGHHYDDVIETALMAMLYGGQLQGMPPMRRADNHPGMALIRPLYRVREEAILAWRDDYGLEFLRCACRFTEGVHRREETSRRQDVKALIRRLSEDDPKVPANIFNSVRRVDLDSMVGWKLHGERHTFLEEFE